MTDTVIHVEGLGKKYLLCHQRQGDQRFGYVALRDVLTDKARRLFKPRTSNLEPRTSKEEFWALSDVSFEVKQGDRIGIIGRNGAGKSTLLKVLSRITEPTRGRIRIKGRVASLLEVGTGFHPELTGRENIFLNGAILGMNRGEIRKKFDEIVAFAEVEKFLDTPVKRYSSGMYVRLAFAVAAHLEPEILVVDEVLAVGDAAFQKKCLGKMQDVADREGRTILFVSHNMAAVAQLCGQAIWLDAGRCQGLGGATGIISSYLASDAHGNAERTWSDPTTAPGDDRVRLRAARVMQDGQVTAVVDINQGCQIALEFYVLKPVRNLICGVGFNDAYGNCLFAHCDWKPNALEPGTYQRQAWVRPQTFAEGRHHVMLELHFYEPYTHSILERNLLAFDAMDSEHPDAVRGQYKGTWPGMLRLGLEWSPPVPRGEELTTDLS